MVDESEREVLLRSWKNAFCRGADFDAWGQPVEAIDVYQRLSRQLYHHSRTNDTSLFAEQQKTTLEKVAVCLESRLKFLEANVSHQNGGISLSDLKRLEHTLENLLGVQSPASSQTFPVDVSAATAQLNQLSLLSFQGNEKHVTDNKGGGTVLPRPMFAPDMTLITVHIDSIGVKDPGQFLDPFVTVSVRAADGKALTCSQETPVTSRRSDSTIIFNTQVHIQKALESLPPGFAIFFEFKHFKPKKSTTSTKCWTFMEQDEIKEGALALELYKKPADPQRRAVRVLTVKPLYLHLQVSLFI